MTYIAKEAFVFRIRLIAFRSEQTACYAATSYRSLPNEPGIFLVVGGLGILQTMPGTGNGYINSFSLPILAISYETYLTRNYLKVQLLNQFLGLLQIRFELLVTEVLSQPL